MKNTLPLLSLIVLASLLLGGCGAGSESAIATSVALTVQAQNAGGSPTSVTPDRRALAEAEAKDAATAPAATPAENLPAIAIDELLPGVLVVRRTAEAQQKRRVRFQTRSVLHTLTPPRRGF